MNTYLMNRQIGKKLHTVEEGSSWRGGGPLFLQKNGLDFDSKMCYNYRVISSE